MKEILTPLEMADKLLKNIAFGIEAIHVGLDVIGWALEIEGKAEIAHYQRAIGPFPAWAPLAEATLEDKAKFGFSPPDNPLLRTGQLRESITHSIEGNTLTFGSKDPLMVFHEFGTSKMPMRPIIGPSVYRNKSFIKKTLGIAIVEGYFKGESGMSNIHKSLGYSLAIGR